MVRKAQDGVIMNFADEFNPEQQTNPFNPHRYDQVADWIERLSPDAVIKLGFHSSDGLFDVVNQAYSLYEEPPGADEIQ
jgi:hypothetical protein